ncbi:hypothetical protein HDV05_002371 [Chytridiales sp. JEL 0842]|nr:hypothetical protein HDV05_002371 [Chytridiales sp. JEL 0842]
MKAVSSAVAHVKSLGTKSALFVSVDADAGKILYSAIVAKDHLAKGLKAIEWANLVAGLVNGKSGGKDDAAQGAGSDIGKLGEVLKLGEAHAKKFL